MCPSSILSAGEKIQKSLLPGHVDPGRFFRHHADEAGAGEGLFFKGNPLLALFLVKGEALAGVFTLREHRSVIGVDDTRQGWGSLEGIKEHANLKDETWSWLFNSGLLAQDARGTL